MKIRKLIATSALACFAAASAQATIFEWSVGNGGNGHFYEWVPGTYEWAGANTAATGLGGYLISITSAAEQSFVTESSWFEYKVTDGAGFGPWIGAVQPPGSTEPAGGWLWSSGEGILASTCSNWEVGEPNNTNGEEAGHMWNFALTWNDLSVEMSNAGGFIVEYNLNPVPEPEAYAAMASVGFGLFRRAKA